MDKRSIADRFGDKNAVIIISRHFTNCLYRWPRRLLKQRNMSMSRLQ